MLLHMFGDYNFLSVGRLNFKAFENSKFKNKSYVFKVLIYGKLINSATVGILSFGRRMLTMSSKISTGTVSRALAKSWSGNTIVPVNIS